MLLGHTVAAGVELVTILLHFVLLATIRDATECGSRASSWSLMCRFNFKPVVRDQP